MPAYAGVANSKTSAAAVITRWFVKLDIASSHLRLFLAIACGKGDLGGCHAFQISNGWGQPPVKFYARFGYLSLLDES